MTDIIYVENLLPTCFVCHPQLSEWKPRNIVATWKTVFLPKDVTSTRNIPQKCDAAF